MQSKPKQERNTGRKEENCLDCKYNIRKICHFFEILGKENQPIPKHIYYKGCEFYLPENQEEHPLLREAVKMFNL